jgi:DDE domain
MLDIHQDRGIFWRADKAEIEKIPCIFPCYRGIRIARERFAQDCIHRHVVLPNALFPNKAENIGRIAAEVAMSALQSGRREFFLLSALRDGDAAKSLFRKALGDRSHPQPRVINTDLAPIYSSAISDSKKEGTLRTRCLPRPVQYLNNILEQDHRAIKRRVNAKQGFPRISGGSTNDSRLRSTP